MGGISLIFCGGSGELSISSQAAWDYAGAVEILVRWLWVMRWISGEWRPLNRIVDSVSSLR